MRGVVTNVAGRPWAGVAAGFIAVSLLGCGLGALINMAPGQDTSWDHRVADRVRAIRPAHPWVTAGARAITRLGNFETTVTALAAFLGVVIVDRMRGSPRIAPGEARFLLVVACGGQLMNWGLKLLFRRDRPPSDGRLVPADFYSFPSGHGTLAGACLVLASAMIVRSWRGRSRLRVAAGIALVLALAASLAASRVWLGVHYASDVLVGFLLGACWAGCCLAARPGAAIPGPIDGRP